MTRTTLRAVLGYFLRGTLVVVPLAVTAYILWLILSTLDQLLPLGIPGLGLVIMLIVITLYMWFMNRGRTTRDVSVV